MNALRAVAAVDGGGARLVRRARRPPLRQAAVALSHGGRGGFVWPGIALAVGAGRRVRTAAATGAAVGSAVAISTALARLLARPRPCKRGVPPLVPCPKGGSLPSDQTAAAFAAAEVIGWSAAHARNPVRAAAVATGLARVAAGVHYPTDVIAGGALGIAVGRAATMLTTRWM